MKRSTLCFAAAILAPCAHPAAQNPDIPKALVDMRQALGGDAALGAIESFVAVGTVTRVPDVGPATTQRLEITCQLPDKFLRTLVKIGPVRAPNGSMHMEPTGSSFEGFNLDLPIRGSRDAAGRPNATFITGPASPEELDRRRTLVVRRYQQEFARLALALFGTSFGAYPMELHHRGQEARPEQQVDVIEAIGMDGFTARLYVDAATHLPTAVSWTAIPSVVLNVPAASIRGPAPEPLKHAMILSDFRVEHGLKWPHLIREYVGSRLVQETRLEKFVVNPKLHPQTFSVPR